MAESLQFFVLFASPRFLHVFIRHVPDAIDMSSVSSEIVIKHFVTDSCRQYIFLSTNSLYRIPDEIIYFTQYS